MSEKRNGPSLQIIARCTGCTYEHSEHYSIEDGNDVDSGASVYCKHPSSGSATTRRRIGDTTWATPDWCPLLSASLSEMVAGLAKVSP